jgi:hypothetical protein
VLSEPVREEIGQVADFFGVSRPGAPNKKAGEQESEVGKHFAQAQT